MRKERKKNDKQSESSAITLKDTLNQGILDKLKQTKETLIQHEEQKKEQERERRIAERKQREKNKTFEELLNETDMNWREYK